MGKKGKKSVEVDVRVDFKGCPVPDNELHRITEDGIDRHSGCRMGGSRVLPHGTIIEDGSPLVAEDSVDYSVLGDDSTTGSGGND